METYISIPAEKYVELMKQIYNDSVLCPKDLAETGFCPLLMEGSDDATCTECWSHYLQARPIVKE